MNRAQLFELLQIDPKRVPDEEEFWAVYATSFYERIFLKFDTPREVENAYDMMAKNLRGKVKKAAEFFAAVRIGELEDPTFWDQSQHRKITENMKAKLVNEFYAPDHEYWDKFETEEDDIARQEAEEKAREITNNDPGIVQHVNMIKPGEYKVEDWYDDTQTVASFINGLKESLNEGISDFIEDFEKLARELEKRRIPCTVKLTEFGGRKKIDVMCGFDYPDSLFDKVHDGMEAVGVQADVSADVSGGTTIKSQRIAGGPKRYSRW